MRFVIWKTEEKEERKVQVIGSPYECTHRIHIRYNFQHARFEGLPETDPAWPSEEFNQQFGVSFKNIPRSKVEGYDERIPAVLVMLRDVFFKMKGFQMPHIFRESPNKSDRDEAIYQINNGTFNGCQDVRIIADLIKVWFRQLPIAILHQLTPEVMDRVIKQGPGRLQEYIGPVEQAILFWLADLLVQVAEYQSENHMGIEQLAIILAPNLFRLESANPMAAVTLSKATVDFLRCILVHRRLDNNNTSNT